MYTCSCAYIRGIDVEPANYAILNGLIMDFVIGMVVMHLVLSSFVATPTSTTSPRPLSSMIALANEACSYVWVALVRAAQWARTRMPSPVLRAAWVCAATTMMMMTAMVVVMFVVIFMMTLTGRMITVNAKAVNFMSAVAPRFSARGSAPS